MTEPIRQRAAEMLEAASNRAAADGFPKAVVGFDGFVDTIARAVGSRRSMEPGGYDAVPTIAAFGGRISAAAGKSMNMELVALEARGGGNGPLMAGAAIVTAPLVLLFLFAQRTFMRGVASGGLRG